MSDHNTESPVVTVVSGSPTAEELAAVLAVVTAAAAAEAPSVEKRSDRPRVGGWKSYGRTLRRTAHPGPGAWRQVDR